MSFCFIFLTSCSSISEQEVFKSVRGKVMKFLKVLLPLRADKCYITFHCIIAFIVSYSISQYIAVQYSELHDVKLQHLIVYFRTL